MKNSNSKQMHSIYSTSVVEIKSSGTSANALIARGAFGRVDIALLVQRQHTSNQQSSSSNIHSISLAAIKTIPNATTNSGRSTEYTNLAKLTREAFAELNSLRLLNGHENVTPLLGFYGAADSSGDGFDGWNWAEDARSSTPTSLCLVFPYHPIDLHEALIYRRFHASSKFQSSYYLPKAVVQSVMIDLLSALNHLHAHCILHRDIKPGNLYITKEGRIQLGDFGLAKIVPPPKEAHDISPIDETNHSNMHMYTENANLTNGLCTLQYRPPEVLLGANGVIYQPKSNEFNGAFDIYSAGCIFAELLTLSGPIFPGHSVLDQLGRIFQILGTPTEDNWPSANMLPDWNKVMFEETEGTGLHEKIGRMDIAEEMNLLSKMLVLDPLQRCSARECLDQVASETAGGNGTNYIREVLTSLLPSDMQVIDPVYFSSSNDVAIQESEPLVFAQQYAAKKAASRRNFVAGLQKINDDRSAQRWVFHNAAAS
jgi:serine/threonine protein kinase